MPDNLKYDPGEHRIKHCWNKPEAGFHEVNRGGRTLFIGKCPNTMTRCRAEQLLRTGIGYPPDSPEPERIYNVHDGVVYEAVSSRGSWHGYPWRSRPGNPPLLDSIKLELERRAMAAGHERTFKHWMKTYGR
jgi:hypothetical protein